MKTFGPGGLPGSVRPALTGRLLRRSAASSSSTNRREEVARQSSGRHAGGDPPRPYEQASDAPLPRPYVVPSLPSRIGNDWEASPRPCGGGEPYAAARRARTAPTRLFRAAIGGSRTQGSAPSTRAASTRSRGAVRPLADLVVAGPGDRRRLTNSLQAPLAACCHQLLKLRGLQRLPFFQRAGYAVVDTVGVPSAGSIQGINASSA